MRHDRHFDVSVPFWCVSCDLDFENHFQILMSALKHTDGLRVFQSGVVHFDARCLYELGHGLWGKGSSCVRKDVGRFRVA